MPNIPCDWRGNEINVGTRVAWHNGEWAVGIVTRISPKGKLTVRWESRAYAHRHRAFGVNIPLYNVMVWPIQPTLENANV